MEWNRTLGECSTWSPLEILVWAESHPQSLSWVGDSFCVGRKGEVLGIKETAIAIYHVPPSIQPAALFRALSDQQLLCALAIGPVTYLWCCNPWVECSTEGQRVFWNVDFSVLTVWPHWLLHLLLKSEGFWVCFLPPFNKSKPKLMICVGAPTVSYCAKTSFCYAKTSFWCKWLAPRHLHPLWCGIVTAPLDDYKCSQTLFMVRERGAARIQGLRQRSLVPNWWLGNARDHAHSRAP